MQNPTRRPPPPTPAAALEQQFYLFCGQAGEQLAPPDPEPAARLLSEICYALEAGTLRLVEHRAATPHADPEWVVTNGWARRALVELAAAGGVGVQPGALGGTEFAALGWQTDPLPDRRVPRGALLRRGAYLAESTTVMPPSVVQAGARLQTGVRVDSHALVGSCTVLDREVIVGCGTMIAGLLMPEDVLPVIVEAGTLIGGNCGLYGSLVLGRESQVYAGTVIRSTAGVYHAQQRKWLLAGEDGTLRIPAGSHITMGVPPADAFSGALAQVVPLLL